MAARWIWTSAFSAGPDLLYIISSSSNSYHYIGSAKLYSMGHGRAVLDHCRVRAQRGVLYCRQAPRHATPRISRQSVRSELRNREAAGVGLRASVQIVSQYSTVLRVSVRSVRVPDCSRLAAGSFCYQSPKQTFHAASIKVTGSQLM